LVVVVVDSAAAAAAVDPRPSEYKILNNKALAETKAKTNANIFKDIVCEQEDRKLYELLIYGTVLSVHGLNCKNCPFKNKNNTDVELNLAAADSRQLTLFFILLLQENEERRSIPRENVNKLSTILVFLSC
jgi:hypothetical protein